MAREQFQMEQETTQGHMGKLIITVLLAVAEWELGEIRDRTQKRMDHKFAAGELTGNVPYGFDCEYTFADGATHPSTEALAAAELAPFIAEHGAIISKRLGSNFAEQELIQLMADLRATTTQPVGSYTAIAMSYTAIAASMNDRGTRTKQGRPWACGNVRSVLLSRHTQRVLAARAKSEAVNLDH